MGEGTPNLPKYADPAPSMWAAILYRIRQSEERDRILSDWRGLRNGSAEGTWARDRRRFRGDRSSRRL
jgi:hypothetical protein